jgi:hypothetical protein
VIPNLLIVIRGILVLFPLENIPCTVLLNEYQATP